MALKLGAEDKKKVAIVAVLGVAVLFLVIRMFLQVFSSGTPPPPLPPTIARTTAAPAGPQAEPQQAITGPEATKVPDLTSNSVMALDPTLHPEWMAAAESLKYEGTGRNIFSLSSAPVEIETPKASIRPNAAHALQVAQGPPPPPPIDLKFFGYEAHSGSDRKVFLLHDDDVFIASVGDVVDHRYKVISIAPFSIQIEDIPYNNTQTLPLIQN